MWAAFSVMYTPWSVISNPVGSGMINVITASMPTVTVTISAASAPLSIRVVWVCIIYKLCG